MVTSTKRELRWVTPPQQARSQQTLDRILAAAEVLIAEKGFEDTPISEIVRHAGSSVGAFYSRFEDKHALLHAISGRFVEQAMATTDFALDPARWNDASIGELLHSVVRFLVSIYREQAGLLRAFVIRNHTDPEFRARQERLTLYVNRGVRELLLARADEIGHPDPELAVHFILTLIFGSLEYVMLFGDMRTGDLTLSDDQYAGELANACLAYLGAGENQT
ncbi:MAG: TetR/AcrR family transcriptional regulator [Deltaproteobacteria bacterium]|nr:TetR/AcrR family transcriptional regulator [Deltaproteobacteria bacterium]MBW2665471.1 TetR/AcrR family transcriptional regulator [Deltaproteobacteria bacterium]